MRVTEFSSIVLKGVITAKIRGSMNHSCHGNESPILPFSFVFLFLLKSKLDGLFGHFPALVLFSRLRIQP